MEHSVKINLPGGFISAGDLFEILMIAESCGAENVRFGNRQQLYFSIKENRLEDMEIQMLSAEIHYEVNDDLNPNIVSSYVADIIFNQEGWLRDGVYKDILDTFDYQPRLKINLVDNQQTFVPFFSGNINFITSDLNNYWYMYIRFPKSGKQFCCPSLIYSDDIALVAKLTENIVLENKDLFYDQQKINEQDFFDRLFKNIGIINTPIDKPLKLPEFYLPYYEGFNKYNNRYWLGIYRRNELFAIDFLKNVCSLCIKHRVGQIYTTPWKSILIKGIEPSNRPEWGLILSKYHLNVRHAANELNWQIEDLCSEGLELKKQLVKEFEEADLRTYQLCFAIKTQPKSGLPGSIIIKKNKNSLYDLLHTRDFNPNSKEYVVYKEHLDVKLISEGLIALCNKFYELQTEGLPKQTVLIPASPVLKEKIEAIYQCNHCLTRFDKIYGDPFNKVERNIEFNLLTEYFCPVCEAPKEDFSLIARKKM